MDTRSGAWLVAAVAAWLCATVAAFAQPVPAVSVAPDGALRYSTDERGNRIIDFSHAGYRGGGVSLPDAPARLVVSPAPGDDGARIQHAIDRVSRMPIDVASGLRGAVVLASGRYEIAGALRIDASGVVLRGSGRSGPAASVLVAAGVSRRTLVVIGGTGTPAELDGTRRPIVDPYVPVGARTFTVEAGHRFAVGMRVVVHRPSTASWIAQLGMNVFAGWRPENRLHWQPGSRDIRWDRTVTAIDGDRITVDAPLTTAIDSGAGGGSVFAYEFAGRIARAGIEHLALASSFDASRPMDEDHAWNAMEFDAVEDAWARQLDVAHFAGSAVQVGANAQRVTVEDVDAHDPVSEVGGFRRRTFAIMGQLTLVQRCTARDGLHDFVTGFTSAGPNVFRDTTARDARGFSGPIESWASGVLYDNVIIRGDGLRLGNVGDADQGAGWVAANSVLWNCEGTDVAVSRPPGAYNLAFGCKGTLSGDGIVEDPRVQPFRDFFRAVAVEPTSLYVAQLRERLGRGAVEALAARAVSTSPDGAGAAREWVPPLADVPVSPGPRIVPGGGAQVGERPDWTHMKGWSWFQAQIPPTLAPAYGPAITRFVPGRYGPGLTDDLEDVVDSLPPWGVFVQHYGLWYDRRRVNHNYDGSAERRTGDVWAPFMELPWARSGVGKAWDGLSKYDLTRFNPWYFDRVASFADAASRKGRAMYYAFYFQHWLVESRAHYVDFPWRPVNAVQATGLPDEVPAANAFYDVTDPVRRDLHRRYIRHTLDVLGNKPNVVFVIDREYTGPLSFVEFWLDTIAEWQREQGRRLAISLAVPKAQVDAILDDPERRDLVSAIEFHDWTYRPDGELFAIRGGINRAPREQMGDILTDADRRALRVTDAAFAGDAIVNAPAFQQRQRELWASTEAMRLRRWREYRDRSASLTLIGMTDPDPALATVVQEAIPADERARMRSVDIVREHRDRAWAIGRVGVGYVAYGVGGVPLVLDLSGDAGRFSVTWVHHQAGAEPVSTVAVRGGHVVRLDPPARDGTWVAWLRVTK